MTTPKIQTFKRGGSRFYVDPRDRKANVPGVTSVIDMLPKPFLKFWAAKLVAETAVDQAPNWLGIALNGDRDGAVDYLKRAPMRNTGKAADMGTEAHDVWEQMARGDKLPRQHPDMQPYINGFERFLAEFEPEFLYLEETVWSETHGYAGSFDAMARIRGELLEQDEDAIVILDWKTTRSGVHAEVALQLNAYANADYILRPDGTKVDLPDINAAAVFHCRPEGWQLVPVRLGEDIFEMFLSLIPVTQWEKVLKPTVLADPVIAEKWED